MPLGYDQYVQTKYFTALDGVRAIAVLLVITVHMGSVDFQWLSGTTGVTAFFVLSGFLITTLALREEDDRDRVSLYAFYVRRCFRILPAYYVTLFLYVALVFLLPALEERRQSFLIALPYFLTYTNEIGVRAASWESPFSHSWSLGIEEKFYFLWPIIAFVILKGRGRARIGFVLCAIAACYVFAGVRIVDYLWIPAYAPILIGCLVALLLHTPTVYRHLSVLGNAACVLAVTLSLALVQLLIAPFPLFKLVFPWLVALLLIGLVSGDSTVGKFLKSRPLNYIGKRSYGIYLLHLIALNCVEVIFKPDVAKGWLVLPYIVSGVGLSVILAEGLYRGIEHPCIAIGRSWSRRIIARSKFQGRPAVMMTEQNVSCEQVGQTES